MKNKKYVYLLALLPFLAVALMYELIPLAKTVFDSFFADDGTGFTISNYTTIFTKLLYQKAILNSLKISLISALAGIVIAFFGAKAANSAKGKLKGVFLSILNMVSNFAGVPLAFAYMILLGNAGVMVQIGRKAGISALSNFNLYTTNGVTLVYIYFQIPLAVLLLLPAFHAIRMEWMEAASLLGAGNFRFWTKVGIPVLMPSIMNTFSVLFANALAAYATVYALMMSSMALLPVQISSCYVGDVTIQKGMGGALSAVMMLIMVIMILLTNKVAAHFGKGTVKA